MGKSGRKGKIADPGERRRPLKRLNPAICFVLLLAGCTHLPEIGGMTLPKLSDQPPVAYPDLTDIPEAPPVTSSNVANAAIGTLSRERGSAERAADQLQKEPFTNPNPAPPPAPF